MKWLYAVIPMYDYHRLIPKLLPGGEFKKLDKTLLILTMCN